MAEAKFPPQYVAYRYRLRDCKQADQLCALAGALYTLTLVQFWRTVRRKNVWLSKYDMMRWMGTTPGLHAETCNYVVIDFFAALNTWRTCRKSDPRAKPPRRLRKYYPVKYSRNQMKIVGDTLRLSNGRNGAPLVVPRWKHGLPKLAELRWNGTSHELLCTYEAPVSAKEPPGSGVAGLDLGEVHIAAVCTGSAAILVNGKELRSKRQYLNKLLAKLESRASRLQAGSGVVDGYRRRARDRSSDW